MTYLLVALALLFGMLAYLRIADHFNIIDKPNERSSHKHITIRGGGIIFPLAILLWWAFFSQQLVWVMGGSLLIGLISFLDDRYTLPPGLRILVHLIAVSLLLGQAGFGAFAWPFGLLAFVLIIGWINAFNFMDGINGITAFYALSVLGPLVFLNLNTGIGFVPQSLLYVLGLSVLVFSWFNARPRARTFAGDVGSVSMAFILAYGMLELFLHTGQWAYILLLSVYGVDAVLTIIHRLLKKENIFQAHRSHFYQYLANEMGWPHLRVSALYAILQLLVSAITIRGVQQGWHPLTFVGILLVLVLIYIVGKRRMLHRVTLS